MNILQKIFTDHYEEIKYTLHPRDTEMENIEKMIHCGDPSFGGALYHCPHCGNFKYVPFHCHSRFCPSCGNKYSMERTTSMTFKLINVKHRHCVFTIDENLRDFFLKERSLLDCLFHSVSSVISRMFFELNKSKNFTPGFIMVLHTFGRDLKWNPHIHCLISEGGLSDDGLWRNVHHFNYSFLRSAFRTALLNEMHQRLGDPFKQIKSLCYSSHKKGFYVYAKPSSCDPETAIKYIGRYLGRPVIATSRIDKYGGLYARHRKTDQQLHKVISKQKRPILRNFNHWRNAILSSFGYDPLECPICRHKMEFLELYFNHQRLSLEELYERSMSRSRGKRSSA